MTCIDWLANQNFRCLILVGWSMGSAAVIQAGSKGACYQPYFFY